MSHHTEGLREKILKEVVIMNSRAKVEPNNYCGYEIKIPDDGLDGILTLINNLIIEETIKEIEKIRPPEMSDLEKLIIFVNGGVGACSICGFDTIVFREYVENRIAELNSQLTGDNNE